MEKYIYIETYGCTANKNNSEILAGKLIQQGHKITNNQDIAETIIINTCIVKGKTENKIKRRIQDLKDSNKQILVTGCMSETNKKDIKKLNPKVNFLELSKKLLVPKIPDNKLIGITQISEGCLGNCTYCKTRLAKGKLESFDMNDIVKSVENDLKAGAKEVWITSQDNANYGMDKDNKQQKLPELLNKILSLKHRFKLRLGMMDPNNVLPILDDLIEVYKSKKIYKFIHIPIQSASNKILKDMNRLYTIEQAEKIITAFKKQIPNITISTDIIVGYPTEQESDHKENIKFIKTNKPDVFNLSKMSIHKGTKAGTLKPIPISLIHKRTTELMKLHQQTAKQNKQKFLNKTVKVFVNKKLKQADNLFEARDENYNIIIVNSEDKSILGKNKEVKIKQIGVHHMIGEIIS
tara:strand:+ start:1255 stop:2478 length:1224 start_codon:yes stop_codon:yes gene_type:complete